MQSKRELFKITYYNPTIIENELENHFAISLELTKKKICKNIQNFKSLAKTIKRQKRNCNKIKRLYRSSNSI